MIILHRLRPVRPEWVLLLAASLLVGGAGRAASPRDDDSWQRTLDRIVPAVVALRISATRPFDTDAAGVSSATGFVVDAERGLILTNRHVVQPGPVTAQAVFLNHEQVDLEPIYRDPVHDFGFFRFDPSAVRFLRPRAIELAPERARVGAEIRVIGNDAGEKLAILDGTLARLDRAAPQYGRDVFNDFNTFYFQAASSTSGGSSGSPVVDRTGRAVALNAGAASRSSSSFFLPLDRVVRALHFIQRGLPVPRGTVQTVFRHQSFDELRRLGLRPETESAVRRSNGDVTGLLVVNQAVPGGPGDGQLEPGDVLLRLAGRPIRGFADLEAILDDSVGEPRIFEVERRGEPQQVELVVQDLHELAPRRYLSAGGGIFHSLSYQQARNLNVPVGGVYVAAAGYALSRAGVPRLARIDALGGVPTPDLDRFEAELARHPDAARVPLRWVHLHDPRTPRLAVLEVDRHWFPMHHCERNDVGLWPCRPSPPAPPAVEPPPRSTRFPRIGPKPTRRVIPSLVFVEFHVPLQIDGAQGTAFHGSGLVIDADAGLVAVDRDTVPVPLGDVVLTFARSISVPGRVLALHPEHNIAVVGYDPALLGDTPVKSATLRTDPLEPGEDLFLIGVTSGQQVVTRRTRLARFDMTPLPYPGLPRFRESNLERTVLTESVSSVGGVLCDGRGRVRALWSSFSTSDNGRPRSFFSGMKIDLVAEMRDVLRTGQPFVWRTLGAELGILAISDARERGLSPETARWLEAHDPGARQVLSVLRLAADTAAAQVLRGGDLLLAVDGEPVTRFREVERRAQAESLRLRILRDGAEREIDVATTALNANGTDRAVVWGGALLQAPPREIATQRGLPPEGVYVAGRFRGSPADRYGLRGGLRILAIDGRPTPDLDSLLEAVRGRPEGGALRLVTEDLDGRPGVLTLELDLHYFPTYDLRRGEQGWQRQRLPENAEATADSGRPGLLPGDPEG